MGREEGERVHREGGREGGERVYREGGRRERVWGGREGKGCREGGFLQVLLIHE